MKQKSFINKENIIFFLVGCYLALVLWITLFSRKTITEPNYYFLKSYINFFSGDITALIEIIGNILLFIPAGYTISLVFKKNFVVTTLMGFSFSLVIETIQLITRLGYFDIGDLLNNTIGTMLGRIVFTNLPLLLFYKTKKAIILSILGVATTSAIIFSTVKISDCLLYQHQLSFAALSDSAEYKNLLVLECQDKKSSDGCISLTYQEDGSLHLIGMSNKENWMKIGEVTLEPGKYSFGGFSGVDKKTVAFELEYGEGESKEYLFIGPEPSVEFTLNKTTIIKASVVVYPNYNCDILARPVIYKIQ